MRYKRDFYYYFLGHVNNSRGALKSVENSELWFVSLWKMKNVVLYPSPGMGHLISMVELGKLIVEHYPSLCITILTITAPFDTGATGSYISAVSATTPSINFHHLPITPLPQDPSSYLSFETISYELLTIHNPNVHQALQAISGNSNVLALVIDFFCTPALTVAEQLNIPA